MTPARASPWKRPLIVGATVTLLLGGGLVARAHHRGTTVEGAPRDPATSSDGVVRQLLQQGERKVTRAALVIDAPRDVVWATITDYARYHEVFGNLSGPLVATPAEGGRTRIVGAARLGPLSWPFTTTLTASVEAAGRRTLSWDEPSPAVPVNRGSWTVTELAPGKTLAVYTLDLEVPGYPAWLVRYVMLNRSRPLLRALAAEAGRRS